MTYEEYEEEYYIKNNKEEQQYEVRYYGKVERLIFVQKYDEDSSFTLEEAKELCENLKECLELEDIEYCEDLNEVEKIDMEELEILEDLI